MGLFWAEVVGAPVVEDPAVAPVRTAALVDVRQTIQSIRAEPRALHVPHPKIANPHATAFRVTSVAILVFIGAETSAFLIQASTLVVVHVLHVAPWPMAQPAATASPVNLPAMLAFTNVARNVHRMPVSIRVAHHAVFARRFPMEHPLVTEPAAD